MILEVILDGMAAIAMIILAFMALDSDVTYRGMLAFVCIGGFIYFGLAAIRRLVSGSQ